ncbi:hypothetical protein F5984_07830 [Rudanella paleaurantiibacter]|uniref:DUF4292 domain-containing protein n=1 Tax=Rudanella paleaurantiibacter TaxID=2614655 RepID=A0A7J5U3N5_9BACT|nr:hypothetical protein [Rudanella paleaurantiibacter]KAB7732112.1 hypothetical protein F5984_07830 [Rudanella paleaurantiibacter]
MSRIVLLLFWLVYWPACAAPEDSTQVQARFDALAQKAGVKTLVLKPGNYQVLIWTKVSLAYGDAQKLYVLDRTDAGLFLSDYSLNWAQNRFKSSERLKHRKRIDQAIWNQLVSDGLLTLPDQSALRGQIFPPSKPASTTTTVHVDKEGEVTIKAPKSTENYVIIGDGVSYRFDIFSAEGHRTYKYHCPAGYGRVRTKVIELQQVVSILKQVFSLVKNPPEICRRINQPKPVYTT